ncbi:hypothetical protein GLOIN_2v1886554 [Rhizophagus irregularis DAOM 181602=DAOM 197198]|nr:hypothetical protein GLOIN_2v1886554 [Rhizophagus irregularis DAOM 181602=DAOM 197198]
MTCSKLFSGDLPELWCSLAIPLLWEDPFSSPTKNHHFIEIYLHFLNDDYKTKLNEYVIHNGILKSNTLFNYPKFIQHLNTYEVYNSIEEWFATVRSLFLLFIETEVNLHSFEVISVHSDVDKIIELTLQNPNFIFNIKNFKLASNVMNNNITRLLTLIYSNCNSISSLYFLFPKYEKDYSIVSPTP